VGGARACPTHGVSCEATLHMPIGDAMTTLTYDLLRNAVAGDSVALRSRLALQPAGGPGDKVMPPTYGVTNDAPNKYATEQRVVDGDVEDTVLLDSVASQANRMELALLEGWEAGELHFPVAFVDFTTDSDLADLGRLTVLEAPHRIADAIFRDSLLDGTLFRLSDIGLAITNARPNAASSLYRYSPTALLFGMWDSTGPKGGLGSKFQRAIVSEIVGFGAKIGVKVGSRVDPLAIEKDAAVLYEHADINRSWTLDTSEAAVTKNGKPKPAGKDGRPSEVNHGNVTPSIDSRSGGVTITGAVQTCVLSFAALRHLRFPLDSDEQPIPDARRREAEVAARSGIAALGVAALVYQHALDFDLRSRCLLLPESPMSLELLQRDGSAPTVVDVDHDSAIALVSKAAAKAAELGLAWHEDALRLVPAPKLIELLKRSRHSAAGEE